MVTRLETDASGRAVTAVRVERGGAEEIYSGDIRLGKFQGDGEHESRTALGTAAISFGQGPSCG
jgi:hypothetical protein